jgi:hypothetical protein
METVYEDLMATIEEENVIGGSFKTLVVIDC